MKLAKGVELGKVTLTHSVPVLWHFSHEIDPDSLLHLILLFLQFKQAAFLLAMILSRILSFRQGTRTLLLPVTHTASAYQVVLQICFALSRL